MHHGRDVSVNQIEQGRFPPSLALHATLNQNRNHNPNFIPYPSLPLPQRPISNSVVHRAAVVQIQPIEVEARSLIWKQQQSAPVRAHQPTPNIRNNQFAPQQRSPAPVVTRQAPVEEKGKEEEIGWKKIGEFRRSLFIPRIPQDLTKDKLATAFREIGNIQELIWIEKETHRCGIIIFVEEESAYDLLKCPFKVEETVVVCEPRRILNQAYPPRIAADAEAPTDIQTHLGGRGLPPALLQHTSPSHNMTGAGDPFAHGAVLQAQAPTLLPASSQHDAYLSHILKSPLPPPCITRNGPPSASQNGMEKLLKQLPFLRTQQTGLEQMMSLMGLVELNAKEIQVREEIRADLEFAFRRIFRNCSVRLYGSSVNTFGVRGSDVDAYLELNLESADGQKEIGVRENGISYYYKNVTQLFKCPYEAGELVRFSKQEIVKLMEKLMRYLAKTMLWDEIWAIPEARTPILKLYQSCSGYSVDVSFSSRLVFQNTGLLILYSLMEPRLRPLVYTVRKWADVKGLTGEKGLTKYALTMLVCFFLNRLNILPTPQQILAFMDKHKQQSAFQFDHPRRELERIAALLASPNADKRTPADLLVGFFHFYSTFPFVQNVMDGSSGEVMSVEKFVNEEDAFRLRYINLQDPFDRHHNIAKTVTINTFLNMRDVLTRETRILSSNPLDLRVLLSQSSDLISHQPLLISISGSKATVTADIWMPKVANLISEMMRHFFQCQVVQQMTSEEAGNLGFERNVLELGPVLLDLHCQLHSLTWVKRRNERKRLTQKKKFVGLSAEWDLEAEIGRRLAEGTKGKAQLHFYMNIFHNKIERDRLGIFLYAQHVTPQMADLFDFLDKFLPEQARRFLRLEEIVIDAEPTSTNDTAPKTPQQPH